MFKTNKHSMVLFQSLFSSYYFRTLIQKLLQSALEHSIFSMISNTIIFTICQQKPHANPISYLLFPVRFQALLLLLSLMAIAKAGIAFPQNPGCPNTEDKNFPQHVKVNLNILNGNTNSRRPSDYHNRSTSPWNLQYVMAPDKNLCIVLTFMQRTAS